MALIITGAKVLGEKTQDLYVEHQIEPQHCEQEAAAEEQEGGGDVHGRAQAITRPEPRTRSAASTRCGACPAPTGRR